VAPPRVIKIHDILTVAVSAQTEVIDEGEIQRRKNTSYRATLADWILLRGLSARPDPMSAGDLTVNGTTRSQYRATSELETANSIKFRIAVEVSEIRPNGLLVIQGQDQIEINGDLWERNLMGEVSPENVLPNGEIQSEKIYKLKITKTERGIVRDGYRRGWFAKFLDDAQPF